MSYGTRCFRCGGIIPWNSICSCIAFGLVREREKDVIKQAASPV